MRSNNTLKNQNIHKRNKKKKTKKTHAGIIINSNFFPSHWSEEEGKMEGTEIQSIMEIRTIMHIHVKITENSI